MAAEKMGIKVERNVSQSRIQEVGALRWPRWPDTIPVSKFPWTFQQNEKCYFLEGKVRIYPEGPHGEDEYVEISAGDLVEFPKGLKCNWDVIEPINKHYINWD